MWVLESLSHVIVAGPFKSQAEMARKLGLSQQYVNRQIQKCKFRFRLDGQDVIAHREKEFVGGGKRGSDKEELAMRLGVPKEAIEKVLRKNRSGLIQTPQGKVKIQKLKPGEKPPLPAVRVLWNDDTEKQDFVSFAAAAKELKIHSKTIPSALKAGRDSFTRKSDGKKFTFEIPEENTPSRKKPKPLSEEQKQKWAEMKRENEIREEYRKHTLWGYQDTPIEEMDRLNKIRRENARKMNPPQPDLSPEEPEVRFAPQSPRSSSVFSATPSQKVVPSPLGGRAVPVLGHLHEVLREKREEKQRQANNARRFQKPGLSKLEKEVEELKLQEELYLALRVKYAGWFLEDMVGSGDETQTVLYNPTTGEDFLVEEEEYELLAKFFLSRGYVDFLSNSDFLENWHYGKLQFPAQKSIKFPAENWMLLTFIKDP